MITLPTFLYSIFCDSAISEPAILLFPIWDKDTIIFLVFMAGMCGIIW